ARGERAVLDLIRELLEFSATPSAPDPASPPSLTLALSRLRRVVMPGSGVYLFSDFRGLEAGDHPHLTQLARHNEVTLFFLHDPLERALPPAGGRYPIIAPGQSQPMWLNVEDPGIRQAHAARFAARQEGLRRLCHAIGARFVSCSTDQDAPTRLQQHLRLPDP
ncbi:MAG: hypothetical protein HQM00_02890, partial [Magnetococcales bacterium]|nr:hypothetical protein [Magnetococcales bacterium]